MSKPKTLGAVMMMLAASAANGQTTWYVDDDNCPKQGSGTQADPFCTIQAGIDSAVAGDEIEVAPGTYVERIDLLGKAITLRGTDGPAATIINGNAAGSVITCDSGEGPDTVIEGFMVTNGDAEEGGGMYNDGSSPTLTNCTFSGNSAAGRGGGMRNLDSSPTLINCTFSGNSADIGGGLYNALGSPTLINCTFSDNLANDGGGMYNSSSSPTLTDCTFSGNPADDDGGGMYNNLGSPTLTNCTFSGNSANDDGGGMYNSWYSCPTLTNCILWDDSPNEIDGSGEPVVTYSDVQGGWGGEGNTAANPRFADADGPDDIPGTEDDNLRLSPGSPCIDAGDSDFIPKPGAVDLDGHARVLCGRVDMGAYEFGIGDYDCDEDVDLLDFENWAACMTGPDAGPYNEGCEAFDFNGDQDVDHADFSAFQRSFGGS